MPASQLLPAIDKERHPAVWSVVHDAYTVGSGSVPFGSKRWLAGYRKFGDEYERGAERSLGNDGSFYESMEDPWKTTGYAKEKLSPTTLRIAERYARASNEMLPDLIRVVVARGMAPKALETAADWYSGGKIGRPAIFSMGWPTLVFGAYASQWTPRELTWLAKSGISPDDYLGIVMTLIRHPTEPNQVNPPAGGLPFEIIRLIVGEGMPVEYALKMVLTL